MRLLVFKPLWGHRGTLSEAADQAVAAGFDGIEGPVPSDPGDRDRFRDILRNAGLEYIQEVSTAGSYVPDRYATRRDHLDSFRAAITQGRSLRARHVTCLGGCDAWPLGDSIAFFREAAKIATGEGISVSFETHRSRSTFNPWTTRDILEAIPELQLTCDFSHWCVVCERLPDTEADVLNLCADRALHIHARIGYPQGPQVPDPRAPEYRYALDAHEQWWKLIWSAQRKRGFAETTATPEFGPDGYLQETPFSRVPVADLWDINQWMGTRLKERFPLL